MESKGHYIIVIPRKNVISLLFSSNHQEVIALIINSGSTIICIFLSTFNLFLGILFLYSFYPTSFAIFPFFSPPKAPKVKEKKGKKVAKEGKNNKEK